MQQLILIHTKSSCFVLLSYFFLFWQLNKLIIINHYTFKEKQQWKKKLKQSKISSKQRKEEQNVFSVSKAECSIPCCSLLADLATLWFHQLKPLPWIQNKKPNLKQEVLHNKNEIIKKINLIVPWSLHCSLVTDKVNFILVATELTFSHMTNKQISLACTFLFLPAAC